MYYQTCPYCGANLDQGEKCDCQAAQKYRLTRIRRKYHAGKK